VVKLKANTYRNANFRSSDSDDVNSEKVEVKSSYSDSHEYENVQLEPDEQKNLSLMNKIICYCIFLL
jgi:hypothetical protein